MITATGVSRWVDWIMAEVGKDMDAGKVPRSCRSFSQLHDHVDANDYLAQAGEAVPLSGEDDP
jgi:hypothetical protein